jgi:hypothetical protein
MLGLYLAQYISYGKLLGLMGVYTGLVATLTIVCRDYADVLALRSVHLLPPWRQRHGY